LTSQFLESDVWKEDLTSRRRTSAFSAYPHHLRLLQLLQALLELLPLLLVQVQGLVLE
jgi:hypothetical protein